MVGGGGGGVKGRGGGVKGSGGGVGGQGDTGGEGANLDSNPNPSPGQGGEVVRGGEEQEEWEEAMGGLVGGEDYELEMERELHEGAESETEWEEQ